MSLALAVALFSFAHCHSHDMGMYVVAINIHKPTANQSFVAQQVLPLDVSLRRDDGSTIHNVKVEVLDSAGTAKAVLIDRHLHRSGTVAIVDSAYVLTEKGRFSLKVTTTDDNQMQPNSTMVGFSVN